MTTDPYASSLNHGSKPLEIGKVSVYEKTMPTDELPFYNKELLGLSPIGIIELEIAMNSRTFD